MTIPNLAPMSAPVSMDVVGVHGIGMHAAGLMQAPAACTAAVRTLIDWPDPNA